mgnify:FL=1
MILFLNSNFWLFKVIGRGWDTCLYFYFAANNGVFLASLSFFRGLKLSGTWIQFLIAWIGLGFAWITLPFAWIGWRFAWIGTALAWIYCSFCGLEPVLRGLTIDSHGLLFLLRGLTSFY